MKIFFLFILLLLFQISYGNSGIYEENLKTGVVFPSSNNSIQMVSETVIYSNDYFNTIFYFSNCSSTTQNVIMGFPMTGKLTYDGPDGRDEVTSFKNYKEVASYLNKYYKFKTFVDGVETVTSLRKISGDLEKGRYYYIYKWNVTFLPNQQVIISNNYYQSPDNSTESGIGLESYRLTYILTTGASWKDNIEKADFYFYLNNFNYYRIHAAGIILCYWSIHPTNNLTITLLSNGSALLEWHFQNLKPDFDIDIFWKSDLCQVASEEDKRFIDKMQDKGLFYDFLTNIYNQFYKSGYVSFYEDNIIPYARFIINSIYACKNYKFDNKSWLNYFMLFKWYKPELKQITLSDKENDMIRKLSTVEYFWKKQCLTNKIYSNNDFLNFDKNILIDLIDHQITNITEKLDYLKKHNSLFRYSREIKQLEIITNILNSNKIIIQQK